MRAARVLGESATTASGPPLNSIAPYLGESRIDDLVLRWSKQAPHRAALRTVAGALDYAALNARVDCCSRLLRELVGRDAVIAVSAALDLTYPVAFFAASRSGNTSALVSPLLHENGLAHVLALCQARFAVLTPESYRRYLAVADRLPDLHTVALTHREPGTTALAGVPTLGELMNGVSRQADAPERDEPGAATACLQFTNGTTGPPKAARLSHRNLLVNAAQTAASHNLTERAVMLNYLPTFHLMHLTAAAAAGATLVLCTEQDAPDAVHAADACRATHLYSLPVRLARLAADPRLPSLKARALQVIYCGGSALPLSAASALRAQFGVPVAQGYGLAEASPLVTCDSPGTVTVGSSGPPVAGTEVRIVDPDTRAVLPRGTPGEIELRGPQLMLGYLDRDRDLDIGPGGWFSTGDIGRLNRDGRLFVVDRLKDVFKCDNWLVSPTEIERELREHPGVVDCAVVDRPHRYSGAVAYGFVVRANPGVIAEDLQRHIAYKLPYYERLSGVEFVDAIPRTGNGRKIARAELRQRARSESV